LTGYGIVDNSNVERTLPVTVAMIVTWESHGVFLRANAISAFSTSTGDGETNEFLIIACYLDTVSATELPLVIAIVQAVHITPATRVAAPQIIIIPVPLRL
jgi:hypothetical protein